MKIITWNVRAKNHKIPKLLAYIKEHDPDVICLQEIPYHALIQLRRMKKYSLSYTYDMKAKKKQDNRYTCVLTALPITSVQSISYSTPSNQSLWDRIVYRKVFRFHECHTALIVEMTADTAPVRIISTRLSAVIGSLERIRLADRLLRLTNKQAINIVCGDLNIMDSKIMNIATGWARGFKLLDYGANERALFERLCTQYNLTNIFRGVPTWVSNLFRVQFDHILIPEHVSVKQKYVSKKLFGSDHRMLYANISLPSRYP